MNAKGHIVSSGLALYLLCLPFCLLVHAQSHKGVVFAATQEDGPLLVAAQQMDCELCDLYFGQTLLLPEESLDIPVVDTFYFLQSRTVDLLSTPQELFFLRGPPRA